MSDDEINRLVPLAQHGDHNAFQRLVEIIHYDLRVFVAVRCATDDLVGWTEPKKDKETPAVRHKGFLAGFEISRQEAEEMILQARVIAGWITAEDLEKMKVDAATAAEAKAAAEAAASAAAAPGNV